MSFDITPTAAQHDLARRTHEFAEQVVRPVALEYDQRQEFPWPVLEEAAERGFYSPLFYRDLIGDPTGLSLPMFMEELFWGCAGIGLGGGDARAGALGDRPGRLARADAAVGAGMLRHAGRSQAGRAGDLRARGRQRRSQAAHPGAPRRRRLDHRRPQDVDRQRRHRQRARRQRRRRRGARATTGRPCSSCPAAPRVWTWSASWTSSAAGRHTPPS